MRQKEIWAESHTEDGPLKGFSFPKPLYVVCFTAEQDLSVGNQIPQSNLTRFFPTPERMQRRTLCSKQHFFREFSCQTRALKRLNCTKIEVVCWKWTSPHAFFSLQKTFLFVNILHRIQLHSSRMYVCTRVWFSTVSSRGCCNCHSLVSWVGVPLNCLRPSHQRFTDNPKRIIVTGFIGLAILCSGETYGHDVINGHDVQATLGAGESWCLQFFPASPSVSHKIQAGSTAYAGELRSVTVMSMNMLRPTDTVGSKFTKSCG